MSEVIPDEAVEAAAKAAAKDDAEPSAFPSRIPDGAVEAAVKAYTHAAPYLSTEDAAREALEAAAPHLLIHVHHHDIENHARSFNEGYETCMAQELADDPTTAQDWLDEKLREAMAEAWSRGHHDGAVDQMLHMENGGAKTTPNPYFAPPTNV